jgi:hypothetical protein
VNELLKRSQERLPADAFARDWLFAATVEADTFLTSWLLDDWPGQINPFAKEVGTLSQTNVLEAMQILQATRLAFFLMDDEARGFVERVDVSAENFMNTVIGISEMPDSVVGFFNSIGEILSDENHDQSSRMHAAIKLVWIEMAGAARLATKTPDIQQVLAMATAHADNSGTFAQVLQQRMGNKA